MHFTSLDDATTRGQPLLAAGPVALIFVEDLVEIASTVAHHARAGFRQVIVFLPEGIELPAGTAPNVHTVRYNTLAPEAVPNAVNALIAAAPPTTWFFYGYNAEYLFHPFCETRTVREMIAFHAEERREAMLTYVVDLYAGDLNAHPNAVSLDGAMLDRSGYYALARPDPATGNPRERQLD